jgi:hypothetical protein
MKRVLLLAGAWGALLASAGCEAPPEVPADALVAFDTVDGVVHVVSGDRGAWVRGGAWNVDRQGVVIGGPDAPLAGPLQRTDDGVIGFDDRGRSYERISLPAPGSDDELAILVHDPVREVVDTVRLGSAAPGQGRGAGPFEPRPSVAVGPDGRIYSARGDSYRITVLSPEGDTLRVLRRRVLPRPVSAAERDSALGLSRGEDRPADGGSPDPMAIPRTKPVIHGLVVDDLGYLWVLTADEPAWSHLEWAVHEPGGRYLGAVATPRMDVHQVGGDFVAGVTRDEAGRETVVVYRLTRYTSTPPPP